MVTEPAIWAALADVTDPEIPVISIVDMGMVAGVTVAPQTVIVEMTPTFVGCPALEIIRRNVIERLHGVAGIENVEVRFVFDPPWTSDRITPAGRERLKGMGIAGPMITLEEVPPCPYCGSSDTHMENIFGPTACRAIYYCDTCRQPFEAIKTV